jgi:hypothetical protein
MGFLQFDMPLPVFIFSASQKQPKPPLGSVAEQKLGLSLAFSGNV